MLRQTPMAKCLDKRLTVLGFEIPDLLVICTLLSGLHLFMGDLGHQFILVWMPTLFVTLVFWIGKRGKPENFIIHWTRFHLKPGTISAFEQATTWSPYKGRAKW